ncbi:MAG: aminotransferase class I/II-fold pyridoxal phosphate-dependent enzyme [Thermodesulfobacteriota bacterium]|nr:aminotransferase class I/II-fold pyridoxal phosphate-dependent enzyme [Thermodesulfobacteriota bacterium]
MAKKRKRQRIETEIVHGIHSTHTTSMDLVPPIHMTSTFKYKNTDHSSRVFAGTQQGFVYTRISNPTVELLQEKIALLEGGEAAIATASGMSAISAVSLSLARPDDNFISCNSIYGGTFALFNKHMRDFRIEPRFLSPSSCHYKRQIIELIDENTSFLYIETPANPTLDIIDIAMWKSIAKEHGLPLIVDNTFATPYLQRPLSLGADIVIHSATKYLGGHGDIIGGIIVGTEEMVDHIKKEYIEHFGPIISPFNAWLVLRGIKTLALRMERHSNNALKVARWLSGHPKVEKVYYPGLESHPCYEIAKRQMSKFSGMLSFEIIGGIHEGKKVMDKVKTCILAVSLGDCETLIQHPASMTHSTYSAKERESAGITDGLIRLSVGIEAADDIIMDLENALS